MELLKEIYDSDVCDDSGSYFGKEYKIRKAMRAVMFDEEGKIALMKVDSDNYYKLPGGGIDEGEDYIVALKRELIEETGCNSEIGSKIGLILEYRNRFNQLQLSYCYFAKVIGNKGKTQFTQSELDEGFSLIWVDIDEAINLLNNSTPKEYVHKYMVIRDLVILNKSKENS